MSMAWRCACSWRTDTERFRAQPAGQEGAEIIVQLPVDNSGDTGGTKTTVAASTRR